MDMMELKSAGIQALSDSMWETIGYIRKLEEQGYRQLAFIRLDLLLPVETSTEQVHAYLTNLRSQIRRGRGAFTHCLGMIRRHPSTEGYQQRIPCLLIFDGRQVKKCIQQGEAIGRYWGNIITEGHGSYCNYNKYRQLDAHCGLGVVMADSMRWKYFKLIMDMGRAEQTLIVVPVSCSGAKGPERD